MFTLYCMLCTSYQKNSLYMPLIELCVSCWLGTCRHCCYLVMCCPHRNDCCCISVVYCVLSVGACGHCHHFIFVLLRYVGWYCHMCGYWHCLILYAVGNAATVYFMVCTAGTATCMGTTAAIYCMLHMQVLPHAWVLPPFFILYKSMHIHSIS